MIRVLSLGAQCLPSDRMFLKTRSEAWGCPNDSLRTKFPSGRVRFLKVVMNPMRFRLETFSLPPVLKQKAWKCLLGDEYWG